MHKITRLSFILFMLMLFQGGCGRQAVKNPNILLITIDTARADYIGCFGSPDVKTPNIDKLAFSGVRFMRTVAPSQCTNPSHASIFTGLYPTLHQVKDNRTPLSEEALTLAEILKEKGYSTLGAVSARHLNSQHSNFAQGFDCFLECERNQLNGAERNKLFLQKLAEICRDNFFAWVHYYDPHGDYAPPPPYDKMYPVGSDYEPVPPLKTMNLDPQIKAKPVDPDVIIPRYKGEISFVDEHIGNVIRFLEKQKLTKKTLIIVVADHGESMTEKGIYFCHAGMYNSVLHIPLIMSMPGTLPEKVEINAVVSGLDIFPTALEIAGAAYEADQIDGRSLAPMFSNPDYQNHKIVISEAAGCVIRAIYKDGYKFIKPYPRDWAVKEKQLFRPWEDYGEADDLKLKSSLLAKRLEIRLENWLKAGDRKRLSSRRHKKLDKKTAEALESLGYIE
jgi:arylsulfatase A-like enzyme